LNQPFLKLQRDAWRLAEPFLRHRQITYRRYSRRQEPCFVRSEDTTADLPREGGNEAVEGANVPAAVDDADEKLGGG
jgi:hypothetical protein